MSTYEKIDLQLTNQSINNGKPLDIEMVQFLSPFEIEGYKKLIGRVKGDKSKIVFGASRDNRTIVLQVYDLMKDCTLDFLVVDKYALWIFEQKFLNNNCDIEYTDYGFTQQTKVKKSQTEISAEQTIMYNQMIMHAYRCFSTKFTQIIDQELFDCENDYYMNTCLVMDSQYISFCTAVLTKMMFKYNIVPTVDNLKVSKLINKIFIKKKLSAANKYTNTLLELPVTDMDQLYDKVMEEVKSKKTFADFENPVMDYLNEIAAEVQYIID